MFDVFEKKEKIMRRNGNSMGGLGVSGASDFGSKKGRLVVL